MERSGGKRASLYGIYMDSASLNNIPLYIENEILPEII